MVGWAEMPQARRNGHVFYRPSASVLIEGGFDGFAEAACRSLITRPGWGRLRPCRRGAISACTWCANFEGIDSEQPGWNGAIRSDSLSLELREFLLRLESRDRVPDHSWLSRLTRARLPHEVHTAIFDWANWL